MKKLKKLLVGFLVGVVAFCIPLMQNTQEALANTYRIVLDNMHFNSSEPIVNVNNRILVPFRDIGEAMGADIYWDEATRTVSMYRGNLYSYMQIGNSLLRYGEFKYNDVGEIIYVSERFKSIDTAPQIINNRSYIPVRALAESLGADVTWQEENATAYITSHKVSSPYDNNDTGSSDKDKNDNESKQTITSEHYGDFSNISHFRQISSQTARNMFEDANNYPFVFVLYDSNSHESKNIVPDIMIEAANVRKRIYGVDIRDRNYNRADMNFLWGFFNEDNALEPTVYFVNSRRQVEEAKRPTDIRALSNRIQRFETQSEVSFNFGDFADTTYFRTRTTNQINNMYQDNEEFILALYDSTKEDSRVAISVIKTAAHSSRQIVYGLDVNRHPDFYNRVDFLDSYANVNNSLPMIFLVYEGKLNYEELISPRNVSEMTGYIEEFRHFSKNQGAFIDFTGTRYTNTGINNINSMFNNKETFMFLIYDSRNFDSFDTVEHILSVISEVDYRNRFRYFTLNEFSNNFSQNRNISNYETWYTSRFTNNTQRPILVYVKDGVIVDFTTNLSTQGRVRNFLNDMYNY